MGIIPDMMASRSESKPTWHGVGNRLAANTDFETWIVESGLDWSVTPQQLGYHNGVEWTPIQNRRAMVRDDNGVTLGVFTHNYSPVQPRQIMGFVKALFDVDDRFDLESAGTMKGGRVIWALARYKEDPTIIGEQHRAYILLTTSFDGTIATTAQATMVRVECMNTLLGSLYGNENAATIRVRHDTKWDDAVVSRVIGDLSGVASQFDEYNTLAERLNAIKISRDVVTNFFTKLVSPTEKELHTKSKNNIDRLIESYEMTLDEGTQDGTAWTALNSVTRYVDHMRTVRRTNGLSLAEARMSSSFLGSGASMKRDAVKALLEMA